MSITEQTCIECKETKPVSEFYQQRVSIEGLARFNFSDSNNLCYFDICKSCCFKNRHCGNNNTAPRRHKLHSVKMIAEINAKTKVIKYKDSSIRYYEDSFIAIDVLSIISVEPYGLWRVVRRKMQIDFDYNHKLDLKCCKNDKLLPKKRMLYSRYLADSLSIKELIILTRFIKRSNAAKIKDFVNWYLENIKSGVDYEN